MSTWELQKALLAGYTGPRKVNKLQTNMPTLDDVTERCPHCQKMARFENYESQRNGQRYHVGLIRCTNKDCKKTTKTETLIGEDMPIIPQAVRDRYKIARNRLKMTDIEAAQKLGFHSRNVLSSMLCHGSANEERIAAFTRLVEEMEAKTHLLEMEELEAEIHAVPKRNVLAQVSNGQIRDDRNLGKLPMEEQTGRDSGALADSDRPNTVSGPGNAIGQKDADASLDWWLPEVDTEAAGGVAAKIEANSGLFRCQSESKLDLINEAVSIIRRIPMHLRQMLLDLAHHEDAADQARTVLERNLNA